MSVIYASTDSGLVQACVSTQPENCAFEYLISFNYTGSDTGPGMTAEPLISLMTRPTFTVVMS